MNSFWNIVHNQKRLQPSGNITGAENPGFLQNLSGPSCLTGLRPAGQARVRPIAFLFQALSLTTTRWPAPPSLSPPCTFSGQLQLPWKLEIHPATAQLPTSESSLHVDLSRSPASRLLSHNSALPTLTFHDFPLLHLLPNAPCSHSLPLFGLASLCLALGCGHPFFVLSTCTCI